MATLTNTRIKNTYDGLLKTTDNDALGGTYKLITDGLGNSSNIYLGTGGNLGIGIIPTEKFHVNGDAIVSGDLHVDAIKPIASSNPIKFKNFASTELVRITDSGNVGIGTTSPDTILEVVDENPILTVRDTSTGLSSANSALRLAESGSGGTLGNYWDLKMKPESVGGTTNFAIANSSLGEILNINYQGNVGIGTNEPQKKLVISETTNATIRINSTKNGSWTAEEGLGHLEFFGNDTSGEGAAVKAKISATSKDGFGSAFNMTFGTTDGSNGVSERMRIRYDGNVGIGTNNPVSKLQIQDDTTSCFVRVRAGTSSIAGIEFGDSDDIDIAGIRYSNFSNNMRFNVNASERMRIDSSGNVGIGTTQPQTLLQLSNNNSSTNSEQGAISFAGDTATRYSQISGFRYNNSNQAGLDFKVYNGALNNAMRITNAGNVGIGTNNPSTKLHVYESSSLDHITIDGNNGDNRNLRFATENSTRWNLYTTGSPETGSNVGSDLTVAKYTDSGAYNGNVLMIKRNSGNVGIGTDNPGGKLEINGGTGVATSGGTLIVRQDGNTSSDGIALTSSNAISHRMYKNSSGTFLMGPSSNASAFALDLSGNVGIGTDSPDANLEVASTSPVIRITNTTNAQGNGTIGSFEFFTKDSSTGGTRTVSSIICDNQAGSAVPGGELVFKTSLGGGGSPVATEKMRINSSGNVGIGTTNPLANLHVYGNGKGATIRSLQAIGLEVQGGGNGSDIAIFKNTSGTEKFSLNTNGQMFNLGMASSSSSNASLMHNSSTGLIYRYTSSIRYKEDVKDLTNAVDKIMKLRPVEFKPKDSLKYTTGMIAEEVFEVMPEITFEAEIEGFDEPQVDGISYEPMNAYYIKAIQEQQEMINELKSDIETLKSQINS